MLRVLPHLCPPLAGAPAVPCGAVRVYNETVTYPAQGGHSPPCSQPGQGGEGEPHPKPCSFAAAY